MIVKRVEVREKYVRSFYHHPKYGKLLPLADNDPLLYQQGAVLVIDADHQKQRMLFKSLKDWDDAFIFFGKDEYDNSHTDVKAIYKRDSYKLAYYIWEPDYSLKNIKLNNNYYTK